MGRRHNTPRRQPQASKRQRYLERRVDLDVMVRFNAQRDHDREVWR